MRLRAPLLLLGVVAALALGCRRPEPARAPAATTMAPALRRVIAARPDSVVGLLIQTRAPLAPEQRVALERAGLRIGSVVGDVVSGRIVARRAPDIASMAFVELIQLAGVSTVQ